MDSNKLTVNLQIKDTKRSKSIVITSDINCSIVKKDEEIKDTNPDLGVKEPIVTDNKKENITETEEMPKIVKKNFNVMFVALVSRKKSN